MQVKLLEKNKNKLSFTLKGAKVSFANALRRSAIEEVPTLAVKTVEFRKNTSVLYDEMIAHRLGLVPIKTDLKSYNLPEKCPCKGKGCAQCQLILTIKEKGPKTVYTSDIKSKDPKAKPVYPKMPIVKLLKGQNLEAEMIAVLGQGKEHSKWNPGSIFYKYVPDIKISKKGESMLECIDACPKKVFVEKSKKLAIDKKTLMDCHLCGACEEISKGEVKLNKDVDEFVFFVESWGQLEPKEIMLKASEYLEEKIGEFNKAFK
ncbi:MAG: DNA-directed RNA polymerase subunit D [Candidatus Woesearchaeota archaeon]|nr:DNA-directed RNA polymerase subunit D [Candidatus Woesearchaeota archaeon]